MLGDGDSGPGYNKGNGSGDVECSLAIAACSAGVQQSGLTTVDFDGVAAHTFGKAGNFLASLAFDSQRGQQAADLGFTGIARHDCLHRLLRCLAGQVFTADNLIQHFFQHDSFLLIPAGNHFAK